MNSRIIAWIMGLLAAVFAGLCVLINQRNSPTRPFVRVGDKTFTRSDFNGAMEYYNGKQILNKMVYEELILQAAKKANVLATDADVAERIKRIERTSPKQMEEAQSNPIKMNEKKNDLRVALSMENLQIKDVKVTDAEIEDFYKRNKQLFGLPTQVQAQIVFTGNAIQAQNAKLMLEQNLKPDVIAQKRGLNVVGVGGFAPNWAAFPRDVQARLSNLVQTTPVGKAAVFSFPNGTETVFIIAKPVKSAIAVVPPLSEIKELVTRTYKLVKAQQTIPPAGVMKQLYEKGNVTFEDTKYESYFQDLKNFEIQEKAKDAKSSSPSANPPK